MAASSSFLSLFLLLVLFHGSFAQFMFGGQAPWQSLRAPAGLRGCQFSRLEALNPSQRVRSEAGITEYYEMNNDMLQCAGVMVRRFVIEPRGLLLPRYHSSPSLLYIVQGRGFTGTIFPGCPETFQSFQQQFEQSEQFMEESMSGSQQMPGDEHQKVHCFRQGDIVAMPAGVTHWWYNDGDMPVVAVQVLDMSNTANQLGPMQWPDFFLAGRHQSAQQMFGMRQGSFGMGQQMSNNILNGFDTQMLAEALGVNMEMARRLQSQNDPRGEIVHVRRGLQMLRPTRSGQEMQQQQQQYEGMSMPMQQQQYEGMGMPMQQQQTQNEEEDMEMQKNTTSNGLDEMFCTMKMRTNIDNPARADIYHQQIGRIARVNSQKLPILNLVQMSATRVVLQRNAMITPYWNMNFHSVMYVTGGRGRVQVVNHLGQTVFDGELTRGQIMMIPQNFAVLKRAYSEGFQWISFNTNHNAMTSNMAGKNSMFRSMPMQVLMNSYRLTMEQARMLKYSRMHEMTLFSPRSQMMRSAE
ncbi:hypothetical protein LUZ60_017481 [Juncus effusus]|nr:hypothetical protein LUZ60_017481 [Juncus effusus]